jgi:hypothetical protein
MAAKKTASTAEGAAAKPKRKPVAKNFVYATLDAEGKPGEFNGPHEGLSAVMDDIGLNVGASETVVIYREVKRGGLKTKVKIG